GSLLNRADQIVGTNFTPTTFGNPAGTLTVATNGGNSTVALGAMDFYFAPGVETFSGLPGDLFGLFSAFALNSSTTVDLTSATLDLLGISPTIDALNGDGTISNNSGTLSILTVGA